MITKISDKIKYNRELKKFKQNVKQFYKCGRHAFLTKNAASVGDDETFYVHVLQYYLPAIADKTLSDHNLGIGVFAMQGFECRNKESKNIFKHFNNGRGNVALSNMKRLWDVFECGHNSY